MDTPCTKSIQADGEHRLEFRGDSCGEITWQCLDCGETITTYSDHQGC
jgi:hypothetical protein